MSKSTFVTFVMLLAIVLIGVTAWFIIGSFDRYTESHVDEENEVEVERDVDATDTVVEDVGITRTVNEYQFKDEFGSGSKLITIKAVDCDRLSGFTGASSHVYCVTGNKELIHLELVNLTQRVVATNIDRIEINNNGVLAYYDSNYNKKSEDSYVTYLENN